MKNILFIVLVVAIVICGSIVILPHLMSSRILDTLEEILDITINDVQKVEPRLTSLKLYRSDITVSDTIQIRPEELTIRYDVLSNIIKVLAFDIHGKQLSVRSKRAHFLLPDVELQFATLDGRFEKKDHVWYIKNVIAKSNVGECTLNGTITEDDSIHLTIILNLSRDFLMRLPLVNLLGDSLKNDEYSITVTLFGKSHNPSINIQSALFNFSLNSNE